MSAEQRRALAMYTHRRFLAENARWAGHLAGDGAALASDLAGGKLGAVPTVVVSAGEHAPTWRSGARTSSWSPGSRKRNSGYGTAPATRCTSSSRAG